MRIFICFSCICLLIACKDDEPAVVKMRVNHYWQPHFEPFTAGHLVQEGNDIGTDRWTVYQSNIDGFLFKMGYVSDIMVKKEPLPKGLVGAASNIKTTLVKVLSSEKVPDNTTFEIRLSKVSINGSFSSIVMGDATSGLSLTFSQKFDCGELCDELSQSLANKLPLIGVFTHVPGGVKLVELKNE